MMLTALKQALGGRRVTPAVPPGRKPAVRSDEPLEREPTRDPISAWSAFLRYVDTKGDESERRFTCNSIHGFGEATLIKGWCHERRAFRSFRIDRIVELVCAESGEVLEPVPHFELLRMTGALKVHDPVLTDVARLLVFLARCDGRYHPLERSALERHIGSYCVRFNGTDRLAEDAVAGCKRLAPDSGDMLTALRRLAKVAAGPRVCRFVLDCGADIIDADGRHAPEEVEWAVEMSAALKSVAELER